MEQKSQWSSLVSLIVKTLSSPYGVTYQNDAEQEETGCVEFLAGLTFGELQTGLQLLQTGLQLLQTGLHLLQTGLQVVCKSCKPVCKSMPSQLHVLAMCILYYTNVRKSFLKLDPPY